MTTKKDPAAVALGRKGGRQRAKNLTAARRREIAVAAANARWKRGAQTPTKKKE